jgi:hypothetical protein
MRKVICDPRDTDGLFSPLDRMRSDAARLFCPAAKALVNLGVSPRTVQAVIDKTVSSAVYYAKLWAIHHGFEVAEIKQPAE